MKKIILCLVAVIASATVYAQDFSDKMYGSYAGKTGYTAVSIGPEFLELVAALDPDDKEPEGLSEKFKSIKILVSKNKGKDFSDEILRGIKNDSFKNLMQVQDGDDVVNFYVKQKGDLISDFVLHVDNTDEEVLLTINGSFTREELSKLGASTGDDKNYLSLLRKLENEK
ncbi:MAG: DUF4252 domain-containing protein [Bacteroidales bacterium]